jgi:hypothetical protein
MCAITYGDFVELLVAPDIEYLQLSEVTSGGWSRPDVTSHHRRSSYRLRRRQRHSVRRLLNEIGDTFTL